ncbi:helix-turn-helix domain-containing protein [Halopelagius longus]|uniref:Bacterio-opsin activator n=1 Tax=Halopelagius longus TaxID=1236180 RepID=A0A1H1DMW4_9EURY|nr:helix-turn-helix domain-containing protein [Halopelagius longus]RDI71395.1 bacterio-opsin activator [Halopelagius longus]SDQ77767.1 Predicted DNA binding protein, contains HTH domain [Halopelagius longus]
MTTPTVIAEIELTHPDLVLTRTIEAVPAMKTELEYQTVAEPGTYYLFFEAHGGDFDAFDAAVAEDPTVSDSRVIIDAPEFRVYRMTLTSTERLVLPKAAELGMRILTAESGESGWLATLEVPEMETLRAFRSHCAERDVAMRVKRLYHPKDRGGAEYDLSPVQRETLVAAYERGYLEVPRETSIRELADVLGVSTASVSARLRRGTKNLVENTILR